MTNVVDKGLTRISPTGLPEPIWVLKFCSHEPKTGDYIHQTFITKFIMLEGRSGASTEMVDFLSNWPKMHIFEGRMIFVEHAHEHKSAA